jgi:hypothetical protein
MNRNRLLLELAQGQEKSDHAVLAADLRRDVVALLGGGFADLP